MNCAPLVLGLCLIFSVGSQPLLAVSDNNSTIYGSPITVSGVNGNLLKNIYAHLEVTDDKVPFSTLGFPRSNEYILRKTRQALQALGYYQPQLQLSGDHDAWTLVVKPGDPIAWTAVEVSFSEKASTPGLLLKLVETSPVKPGTIVDHGRYEAFKAALESTARQLGYLDVEFSTKEFYILEDLKGATLKWVITLGPRYRIKDIIFTSTDLSWDFLKKYLKLQPGDFYDFDLILATQQRLNRSGHFASVCLDTDVNKQSQTVSLIYNCSDRQKYQFKSSIGFGTDTGGRLGVEWQDRRVNARGHSYSVNSDLNNINRGVSFNYRIPTASAGSEWINRASYHIQDLEVATSHITSFESRLVYKLDEHWTTQYALLIATEEVYKNQFIDSYLKYVIPMWQVDYYNDIDPFRAESGFHWRSILRLSDATFTSPNLNFQQTEQQFKWLYPLSSHWRLISLSQLGITAINDDSFNRNMPVNYRFFAGGDTSIRGYDYQSLAPVNDSGELLGGRHLVTQTLEFDYRFSDNWRWALFVDAGNSFNDLDDFKVKRSVGTGVRWLTPVGSIRFDVARGLDDPNDWRVHITIGPDL